ncbi:hypothetical protein DY000_02061357 [Brassica cretica]|uniref:Uncharacterized protein n=1 Tax=Brassica cretica TaxID=69181 RepID=A0ABQ7AWH3_BRACR|nr:hypothetical protein DY000_02061357 [Brassica cretica]
MSRRLSRSEKGKMQAPQELPPKKPPVRIPANTNDDLIEANRRGHGWPKLPSGRRGHVYPMSFPKPQQSDFDGVRYSIRLSNRRSKWGGRHSWSRLANMEEEGDVLNAE